MWVRVCQLRKFNLPQELLKQFYSGIIESVLCTSITVWFSSATKSDLRSLLRVVWTAQRTIGTILPTLQDLYLSRESKRAGKITLDPSQNKPTMQEEHERKLRDVEINQELTLNWKTTCSEQIQNLNLSSICLQCLRFRIADVAIMCVLLTVLV